MKESDTAVERLPYRRCVGAALFSEVGLVWVGRRIPRPGQQISNYWQMPQGGIDDNEDPSEAVIRELHEETGISQAEIIGEIDDWLSYDLPPDLVGKVWSGQYRGQSQKWFALRFGGSDADFHLSRYEKPEFDAWKWVELGSLPNLIIPFKKKIYQRVVDEFEKFRRGLGRQL